MFDRGSVAASFLLITVSNEQELQQLYRRCLESVAASFVLIGIQWERIPATIPQMFGRGSVAASIVLIIVSNGQELQQLYHSRGSVAASFVLIIVSNGQELQQLYHRCLVEDQ